MPDISQALNKCYTLILSSRTWNILYYILISLPFLLFVTMISPPPLISQLIFSTPTRSSRPDKQPGLREYFQPIAALADREKDQGWVNNYSLCLHSSELIGCGIFLLKEQLSLLFSHSTFILCPFTSAPLPLAVRTGDGMWNLCSVMGQFQ